MKKVPSALLLTRIISDCERALTGFTSLPPQNVAKLRSSIKRYGRSLLRLSKKGPSLIEKTALHSFDAHICAALRAADRAGLTGLTFFELSKMALRARAGDAATEAVSAYWDPKDNGGFRLIVRPGLIRNTRHLVFRDGLTCLGFDNPYDFSRSGAGGETAFVAAVVSAVCSGQSSVATADMKKCFASMRPAHFQWAPLNQQLLQKEVFISEEANVEVELPGNLGKLWTFLQAEYGAVVTTSIMQSIISLTTQMVRQALPEGGLLSPLLARSFIGREIQATLGSMGVAISSFVDDLAICACAQTTAAAAMHALEMRLKSHPAGPIELHAKQIRDANAWKTDGHTEVLKYLLEPGNGYGDNPVHVKPGPRRISKFKKRLKEKLDQAKAEGKNLYAEGLRYWKQWFASQHAWTKVPGCSELVSEAAAMSYIEDYILGIPMGSNAKVYALAA